MEKKAEREGREFDDLKKIGFEFRSPQDEFSYQPDSGSTAHGIAAKQEYGIDVDLDADTTLLNGESPEESPLTLIPGESEWSQENRLPSEDRKEFPLITKDDELFATIYDRLIDHPRLRKIMITIRVVQGVVTLCGEVPSDVAKRLLKKFPHRSRGKLLREIPE